MSFKIWDLCFINIKLIFKNHLKICKGYNDSLLPHAIVYNENVALFS